MNVNRREFLEKSAKTAAVVVIVSAIPASITRGAEGSPRSASHVLKQAGENSMKDQQGSDYYITQKSKLLEDIDKQALNYSRKALVPQIGDDLTNTILRDVRQEY